MNIVRYICWLVLIIGASLSCDSKENDDEKEEQDSPTKEIIIDSISTDTANILENIDTIVRQANPQKITIKDYFGPKLLPGDSILYEYNNFTGSRFPFSYVLLKRDLIKTSRYTYIYYDINYNEVSGGHQEIRTNKAILFKELSLFEQDTTDKIYLHKIPIRDCKLPFELHYFDYSEFKSKWHSKYYNDTRFEIHQIKQIIKESNDKINVMGEEIKCIKIRQYENIKTIIKQDTTEQLTVTDLTFGHQLGLVEIEIKTDEESIAKIKLHDTHYWK